MYKQFVVSTILILFVITCNNLYTDTIIYGNWEGSYNAHKVSFVFKNDNTCIYKYYDKQLSKFEIINGDYNVDFSKNPIPLSIRNINQLNHSLYTIVEFIGGDSIRIAGFSPKWKLRPISFEIAKTISLKRIQ
jgi:hypothetical protein